jgi:hypothetical protein
MITYSPLPRLVGYQIHKHEARINFATSTQHRMSTWSNSGISTDRSQTSPILKLVQSRYVTYLVVAGGRVEDEVHEHGLPREVHWGKLPRGPRHRVAHDQQLRRRIFRHVHAQEATAPGDQKLLEEVGGGGREERQRGEPMPPIREHIKPHPLPLLLAG